MTDEYEDTGYPSGSWWQTVKGWLYAIFGGRGS